MQANKHSNPSALNGQPAIKARAFCVAFIPTQTQTNITQMWSLKASEAIGALINFRSAIHRWQAAGKVNDAEFIRELEKLEDCGLAGWTDELIGLATVAICGGER